MSKKQSNKPANGRATRNTGGSWFWTLIIAVVMIAFFPVSNWLFESNETDAPTVEQAVSEPRPVDLATLQSWPLSPPRQVPSYGDMPQISGFDPFPFPLEERFFEGPGLGDLSARVMYLIHQNVIPEVERMKARTFEGRHVGLVAEPMSGMAAQFSATNRKPRILYDPLRLAQAETPEAVLVLMLSTYHELGHYEQWLDAPPDEQVVWEGTWSEPGRNQARCEHLWVTEREMYFRTCQKAVELGVRAYKTGGLCNRVLDRADFDHQLAGMFHAAILRDGFAKPECIPHIMRLAGHPHPEAFPMEDFLWIHGR